MMHADSDALLQRAAALRRAGRVAEAIIVYEQLLEREPHLADAWYNLGFLQRQARQYEGALDSYAEALKRGVRAPEEVHLNRAVILSDDLRRPEAAQSELTAALGVNPDFLPALLNLGNLHEDRGDRSAAQAAYRRALEVAPGDALALSRLAGVSQAPQLDLSLAERLRQAIARPGTSAAEQAHLGFALAGLLDAAGRFDEAFGAARAANEASRVATGARYDRAAAERFIDRLIATVPASRQAVEGEPPVFILGMYRSGSTLVEQMLAGHDRIEAAGELDLLLQLAMRIPGYPEAVATASDSAVDSWRRFYLEGTAAMRSEGALLTDKRPDNFLHIGLIKALFPNAKIVHTRRNRLDNLLSLYFLHLDTAMAYALDLGDAAHWYAQYQRLMDHWRALYPNDIFELDYDALVRTPVPIVENLLRFLGLDWQENLLDFAHNDRPVRTASVWQVRQPLHARSSGRWRNYEKWLGPLR